MPAKSLGDILRSLREEKNISREQLYSQTKILVKYIEALENGRWDLLPGQVYLKPFVKNIADALGADYDELCSIIDKIGKKPVLKAIDNKKTGFDYRWLAVALMVILAGLIILLLKPAREAMHITTQEQVSRVVVPGENHAIFDRQYTSHLDTPEKIVSPDTIHTLEIIATDTVWLMLTANSDTIFFGNLDLGRRIVCESVKPFKLNLGKSNTVEIIYDDVKLDNDLYLLNKRHLDFSQIKPVGTASAEE